MNKKQGWKRLQRLSIDRKRLSKQALKAEAVTKRHAHRFVVQRLRALRDVRQHIASWILIVGALIGIVALQMTWYQSGYRATAGIEGGTYAEGVEGPIDTLNPLFASTAAEQSASYLLFSRLFDYDATGHLRNDVAKSMTLDESLKTYTITLRDDVHWHDGTNLTADDIVYTVETMKNPEVRAVMRNSWHDVSIKKIDTKTVQFILPASYASFPHALTFAILPKHILADVKPNTLRESTYSVSPVGSGPFKMRLLQTVASIKDSQKIVHLIANEKYYRGAPKLARFELHAYNDGTSLARSLKLGDINAAAGLSVNDEIPAQMTVADVPVGSGVYALFNTKAPQLADVTVRQALQRGTDTAVLRKKVGVADFALDLPFIPAQIESSTLPTKPAVNVDEAKSLLEKAGWKLNGTVRTKNDVALKLKIVTVKDARYKAVSDELTRQWKQLGVGVEATEYDPKTNQQSFAQVVLQPRSYDILINELMIGGDADVYAYWHSSQAQTMGYNFSNYQNGIVDDNLSSARVKNDVTLRARKYTAFASQWLADAPAIGLFQSSLRYAHTKTVAGISSTSVLPTATDRYANIAYWTAERGQVYKTP